MKLLSLSLLLILFLSCKKEETNVSTETANENSSLNSVYKHSYGEDGSEDVYIILHNGAGYLYGTSDEFDMGREGYLPGFLKAGMKEILYTDSTLSFRLGITSDQIHEQPFKYSENPAGSIWSPGVGMEFDDQAYSGRISGDSLLLTQELMGERLFIKM